MKKRRQFQRTGKCPLPDEVILALLDERQEARIERDWDTADALLDDLRMAGVELFDSEGIYETCDGRSGPLPSHGDKQVRLGTAQIYQILRKRQKARQFKDFDLADDLRAQLEAGGIDVDDSTKTWTSRDGREGSTDGKKDRKQFWGNEKTQQKMPGDWSCPNCMSHNFARRDTCFKCDTAKPL
jgi:cysteinyl-tRNA synthetase